MLSGFDVRYYRLDLRDRPLPRVLDDLDEAVGAVAPDLPRGRARQVAEVMLRARVTQTAACGRAPVCAAVPHVCRPACLREADVNDLPHIFAGAVGARSERRLGDVWRRVVDPLLQEHPTCGRDLVCRASTPTDPFAEDDMRTVTVGSIMTREMFAVAPDTSLVTAARLLAERHITGAPVIDANGKALGVVTLKDLADPDRDRSPIGGRSVFYRLVEGVRDAVENGGYAGDEGMVADVMTPFILAVRPETTVLDAARLMVKDEVHRLLVVDETRLLGIVTMTDVLRALVGLFETIGRTAASATR